VAEMDEAVGETLAVSMKEAIEAKLELLDKAIGREKELEIDGITTDEETGEEGLKILHHPRKQGYFLPMDVIMKTPVRDIVKALLSGDPERMLIGYSRIVGYFSRTSNWSISKRRELEDRAKGNYGTGKRVLNEDTERALKQW